MTTTTTRKLPTRKQVEADIERYARNRATFCIMADTLANLIHDVLAPEVVKLRREFRSTLGIKSNASAQFKLGELTRAKFILKETAATLVDNRNKQRHCSQQVLKLEDTLSMIAMKAFGLSGR